MGKVTVEHEPPYMTDEVWKVRVGGRLIGLVRDKATADLLSGAEACREALRECLEVLDTLAGVARGPVGDLLTGDSMSDTGLYDALDVATSAIATARLALGLEATE